MASSKSIFNTIDSHNFTFTVVRGYEERWTTQSAGMKFLILQAANYVPLLQKPIHISVLIVVELRDVPDSITALKNEAISSIDW